MSGAPTNERRSFRRLPLSLPIRVWGTDPQGRPFHADGSTVDLSSGGVRFRIPTPPDPDRALMVSIAAGASAPADESFRLRATLEVLRVEPPAEDHEDWVVAGRYRPEESEWVAVESC